MYVNMILVYVNMYVCMYLFADKERHHHFVLSVWITSNIRFHHIESEI